MPMISFPRALLAATIAWLVAVFTCLTISGIEIGYPRLGIIKLQDWLRIIRHFALPFGIVIFTTLLAVVAPLLAFVPRTSRLWKPGWACPAGAVIALLCSAGCQPSYSSYLVTENPFYGHLIAILCGVTFAFIYAVLMARHRAPRQPVDDA